MGPLLALFGFTIRSTLLARKLWAVLIMLAAPSMLLVLIRLVEEDAISKGRELWEAYHVMNQFLILMVAVPLVCMVYGVSLISAEVESRTFVYLVTRRMRRATVFLIKYVATACVLALLCDAGAVSVYFATFSGVDLPVPVAGNPALGQWNPTHELMVYLAVIPAAVCGFLALFAMVGLLARKPLGVSAFYWVMVELILSNMPTGARVYSLLHPLRLMMIREMPGVTALYELPQDLLNRVYRPDQSGLIPLLIVILVSAGITAWAVSVRELLPTKVSQD